MSEPAKRFEITPELIVLQDAVNKDLAGAAKVNLFIRNDQDRPRWCVIFQDGAKRTTSESDVPLTMEDKDDIVKMAREWLKRPKPVHSKYQPYEM